MASRCLVIPSPTSSSSFFFFPSPAHIHLLALFSEQLSSTCHPATTSWAVSVMQKKPTYSKKSKKKFKNNPNPRKASGSIPRTRSLGMYSRTGSGFGWRSRRRLHVPERAKARGEARRWDKPCHQRARHDRLGWHPAQKARLGSSTCWDGINFICIVKTPTMMMTCSCFPFLLFCWEMQEEVARRALHRAACSVRARAGLTRGRQMRAFRQ